MLLQPLGKAEGHTSAVSPIFHHNRVSSFPITCFPFCYGITHLLNAICSKKDLKKPENNHLWKHHTILA